MPKKIEFEVGQRVKVIDKASRYFGLVSIIGAIANQWNGILLYPEDIKYAVGLNKTQIMLSVNKLTKSEKANEMIYGHYPTLRP